MNPTFTDLLAGTGALTLILLSVAAFLLTMEWIAGHLNRWKRWKEYELKYKDASEVAANRLVLISELEAEIEALRNGGPYRGKS